MLVLKLIYFSFPTQSRYLPAVFNEMMVGMQVDFILRGGDVAIRAILQERGEKIASGHKLARI